MGKLEGEKGPEVPSIQVVPVTVVIAPLFVLALALGPGRCYIF